MKSLVSFELYKIFQQKSIYFALITLLGLISISNMNSSAIIPPDYKEWEGKLTEEKVERAKAANQALNQMMMEHEDDSTYPLTPEQWRMMGVYEEISVVHRLEQTRLRSIHGLDAKSQKYGENGNELFEQRQTKLQLGMLKQLELDVLYYNRAPAEMIDSVRTFGTLVTGALILIGLAPIFSNEYATGMDQFLLSSRHGRRRGVYAKITASIIYVIVVIAVWTLYNLAYQLAKYVNGGWQSPIQQMFQYRLSPYDYDMLTYYLIQTGVHALGALGFALLVLLVSALCRNTMLSLLISGSIFALPIALVSIFKLELGQFEKVLEFSYINVMRVSGLFDQFKVINLFDLPVLYPIVAVSVMSALALACAVLLFYTMKRKEVA